MWIPRELGIHHCHECKEKLIDSHFQSCGIGLHGDTKWKVFFIYQCSFCSYEGSYILTPQKKDLPGNLFRQFANALDTKYFRESEIQPQSVDDFMRDPQ